jgi:oligopeptide/dipeptide ABC transporter ATP-binding protein
MARIENTIATAPGDEPVLRVDDLHMHFKGRHGSQVRAVDGVSIEVRRGETLAIVGESGSGKSTLARALMRLIDPTSGRVYFHGQDLLALRKGQVRELRRNIQMIFQDPYASLHPLQTTSEIVTEPWRIHRGVVPRADFSRRVAELLSQVGLPQAYASMPPARLSGGERQRIAIARAIGLSPEVLVLDEPVSALDVSIQAQVIKLLMRLQQELQMAYVFISHDLALVRLIADHVVVMYRGRIVEQGTAEEVYSRPAHPYTQALLAAAPSLEEEDEDAIDEKATDPVLLDRGPSVDISVGCRFRDRCWRREARCDTDDPRLVRHEGVDHDAACHFAGEVARSGILNNGAGPARVTMTTTEGGAR